jgi:RluA family pseudouridine synthase
MTRLDRDTYGIVLLAKNTHIHALLQQGDLQKTYHALTFGCPESDSGNIDAPIARRELPSLLRYISPEGKPSVTEFRLLERTEAGALLALRPITGRTHQLRLHCFHMGFPILGDPQYCTEESAALSREMGLTHQLLLAHSLEFNHPITGAPMHLTTSLPIK